MGRRKKTSAAEDVIELIARLPWWVGVALAVVSYLWLHGVAERPFAAIGTTPPSGGFVVGVWLQALATAGQYLLPIICLAGAGLSAWRRKQRRQLVADVTAASAPDVLEGMTWREFEMLVGEAFRLKGYQVEEIGGSGADGGIDLVLSRPGVNGREKLLVQCKQWRAYKVGVDVVRQLYGVMAATGAAAGVVVTSGRFTGEAASFASGRSIQLIDGPALHQLIREATVHGLRASPASADQRPPAESAPRAAPPGCPSCSRPMVRRTAKRGPNAGSDFWACPGYPGCRGTRPIG